MTAQAPAFVEIGKIFLQLARLHGDIANRAASHLGVLARID